MPQPPASSDTAVFPPGGAQTEVTGLLSLSKEPASAVLLNPRRAPDEAVTS